MPSVHSQERGWYLCHSPRTLLLTRWSNIDWPVEQLAEPRPPGSPHGLFKGKKGMILSPWVDYQLFNTIIPRKLYPLLLTVELVDSLLGANKFTKLEVQNMYWKLRVSRVTRTSKLLHVKQASFLPLTIPSGAWNQVHCSNQQTCPQRLVQKSWCSKRFLENRPIVQRLFFVVNILSM